MDKYTIESQSDQQDAVIKDGKAVAFIPKLSANYEETKRLFLATCNQADTIKEQAALIEQMGQALQGIAGLEPWIGDPQSKDHFVNTVYPALKFYQNYKAK